MKNLFCLLLWIVSAVSIAQSLPAGTDSNASIGGFFENVFDQNGNKFKLSDIKIKPSRTSKSGSLLTTNGPVTAGYYNLYFETGSGMESTTITQQIMRRQAVVKVFEDLSAFINSPLTSNGLNKKVNIWVRNINETLNASPSNPNPAATSGVLGSASSYYINAFNLTPTFGGIADNEIWKTIHAGKDSYTNVIPPLVVNGINAGLPGVYFHGTMAFNFNNPNIIWHTDLTTDPGTGIFDLYSVVLHEVTHALGFASLINQNGLSKLEQGYNYFTRYDRFLRSNSGTPLLTNTGACSTMYDYTFNTSNPLVTPSVLRPGCQLAGNTYDGTIDSTVCSTAIKFFGAIYTTPVYTPVCFEKASSLSHFEDQCLSPSNNNGYFAMSETSPAGHNKRYLKMEERSALCDLGYSVNTVFGDLARRNNFSYGGSPCGGIVVAGINDGIEANGLFSFVSNSNSVSFSGILTNDTNATGFECLYDITTSTAVVLSGSNTTTVTVNRNGIDGLHLLRYVPTNGTQKGNITYVYVYFLKANCASPGSCNMVINGEFESNIIPNDVGQISNACGWGRVNISGSSDLYHYNSTNAAILVPCNKFGIQTDKTTSNKAYAGMWFMEDSNGEGPSHEPIMTKLASPLLPNTTYKINFDVSLAEATSGNAIFFQAYLSTNPIVNSGVGNIPIDNPSMLFTNPTYNTISNGWQTVTFTFTTPATAGQQYLYIGGLKDVDFDYDSSRIVNDNTCPHFDYTTVSGKVYYYLDNVSLKEQRTPVISGSTSACTTVGNNATSNTATIPAGYTGQWTVVGGTGTIVGSSNQSTFNVNWAQLPGYISFSLTNPNGCVFTQTKTIVDQCACNCLPTTTFTPVISNNVVTIAVGNTNPGCISGSRKMVFNFGDDTIVPRIGSIGSVSHAYATPGTYTVNVSVNIPGMYDENLCTTSNFTFNVQPTADPGGGTRGRLSEDEIGSPIIIYPNPVSSEINIDFNHQTDGEVIVKAHDMNGKLLFSHKENIEKGNQHLRYLVPASVSDGVLILEVQYDGHSVVKKIMINN